MDKIRDRLWSVQDVADYLGIPPRTLYNWRCRGIGPRARLGRRLTSRRTAETLDRAFGRTLG